jgi:hypothetical protein
MTVALLQRAGWKVYRPLFNAGFDLLIQREQEPCLSVLVLSVASPKPIVPLKTTRKGESAVREFDVLFCIHLDTLCAWQIPEKDVPEKESLYLSKRYNEYRLRTFTPEPIHKREPRKFEMVQEEMTRDIEELEAIASEDEINADDVWNLFKDDENDKDA